MVNNPQLNVSSDVSRLNTREKIERALMVLALAGTVLTTHYTYDGRNIQFQIADKSYKFQMTNEEHTEMKQVSDAYCNPTYQLSEKD